MTESVESLWRMGVYKMQMVYPLCYKCSWEHHNDLHVLWGDDVYRKCGACVCCGLTACLSSVVIAPETLCIVLVPFFRTERVPACLCVYLLGATTISITQEPQSKIDEIHIHEKVSSMALGGSYHRLSWKRRHFLLVKVWWSQSANVPGVLWSITLLQLKEGPAK